MNHEINKSDQEIQSMLTALEGTGANQVQWTADFSASGVAKDNDIDETGPA